MIPVDVYQPVATGFMLGLACIFSIGPQNLQLIERGITRDYAWTSATVGYASEIFLVVASVSGIGTMVNQYVAVQPFRYVAAIFLALCGVRTLRNAVEERVNVARQPMASRSGAVSAMLGVTFLNPLTYIEIVIIGGLFASTFGDKAGWFGVGFLVASFVRFFGLATFGWLLAPWLANGRSQLALSRVAGTLLLAAAASQALSAG